MKSEDRLTFESPRPFFALFALMAVAVIVLKSMGRVWWCAQGDLVPWLCSQTDLLAMDWQGFTEAK